MDVQLMGGGHTAIVFKGFGPDGFDVIADEGDTTYLYALGGGEKCHVGGIVIQGVDQAAFFQDKIGQAGALGFQATSDTDGSTADDDDVVICAHGWAKLGIFTSKNSLLWTPFTIIGGSLSS